MGRPLVLHCPPGSGDPLHLVADVHRYPPGLDAISGSGGLGMKWLVRACFAFTWLLALGGMVVADRGIEFVISSVLFVVVPFVYVGLLEEIDG